MERRNHSAYTLLEVILALALTTVLLGLIGMAMHIHLGVADKSRGQVEEAQLARTLLQHIAEDIRNSVPFTPTASSGSAAGETSTSSEPGTSTVEASISPESGTSTASGTSTTSDSGIVIPAGISGTAQILQMDTSRRVRPIGMAKPASGDNSLYIPLGDVKTVTYSFGDPGTVAPSQRGDVSSDAQSGLFRREIDRPVYVSAMQQGQADILTQATAKLAPEVVGVQFTYYDGTTTYDQWDSNTQGGLPIAIKVAIMIRRTVAKLPSAGASADNSSFAVYDILVDLPNSQVQGAGQSSGSPSSGGTATQSTTPSTSPSLGKTSTTPSTNSPTKSSGKPSTSGDTKKAQPKKSR